MFKVVDGIYQVRGYDMSNLTLVEGETGWIMFDTLISVECSQAALALANEHLSGRPVRAVIVSRPHIDHYGGIKGIMSTDEAADRNAPIEEQLASGKIPIIVPTGFFGARRVREHVRRLRHEAPRRVPIRRLPGQRPARVACHGHRQRAVGRQNKLHPPHVRSGNIRRMTDHRRRAHAVPADARHRSAGGNEHVDPRPARAVGCRKLHRHAAQPVHAARRHVRGGNAWAKYITEAVALYDSDVEVTFQSHNWPHWGNAAVNDYMVNTAAIYKFINDQAPSMLNNGKVSAEIAHEITLPAALEQSAPATRCALCAAPNMASLTRPTTPTACGRLRPSPPQPRPRATRHTGTALIAGGVSSTKRVLRRFPRKHRCAQTCRQEGYRSRQAC